MGKGRSTLPESDGIRSARVGRILRRIGVLVLVVFVALGATGFFGVRSASVRAEAGGLELVVQYPSVTRPGLASPWGFQVRQQGGFGEDPVVVATSLDWLNLFDENGRNPAPSAEYVDGEMVVWEFDPPEGEVLHFEFDARLGPSVQSGLTATTQLRKGNVVLLEVRYRTRVYP